MGLEIATFISQLVAANPVGTDDRSTADDHMRLIKTVLQATFTNATAAINPTPTEFNILDGAVVTTAELNRLQSFVGTINRAVVTDASGNLVVSPVTTTELNLLDGLISSTAELNRLSDYVGTASRALVSNGTGQIVVSLVTTTELNLLDGLLASTAELNTMNGILSTTAELNRLQSFVGTANRAIITDASGNLIVDPLVSNVELSHLNTVSSNIQTQLNGKAASAHSHTGAEISALDAGDTTTGVFAAARIPTHTGEVTGQTNLLLADSAITGQADIAAAIVATDELLISDAGVLKRTDISRITTFLNPVIAPEGGGINLQTAQATTSGSAKTFSGIPSWVTRIKILLNGVSTSVARQMQVKIGDAGGIESTGYSSENKKFASSSFTTSTATTLWEIANAVTSSGSISGICEICKVTGNTWEAAWNLTESGTNTHIGGGLKTLTATLDRVEFSHNGTGNFDAGSVNVSWS